MLYKEAFVEIMKNPGYLLNSAKNIFFTLPTQVNWKDMAKYSLVGAVGLGTIGAIAAWRKKKRLAKILGMTALGGTLGAYAYGVKQNWLKNTNGLWEDGYWKKNHPVLAKDDPLEPQTYIVYVPGAYHEQGFAPKLPDMDTLPKNVRMAVFPHGDVDRIVEFGESLRPQDRLTVVAHSAGGGGALEAIERMNRQVDAFHTLDAVDLNPFAHLRHAITGYKKPKNVKIWYNHLPYSRNMEDIGAGKRGYNPWLGPATGLVGYVPDAQNIIDSENHGMLESGFRVTGSGDTYTDGLRRLAYKIIEI